MLRIDLRYIGAAAFLTAIALASCGGGGGTSGASSNPTGVIPTPTPAKTPTPTPCGGCTPTPVPTATPVSATINFSGSVNASWFQIVVLVNGSAMITGPSTTTPMPGTIPPGLTATFFTDLNLSGGVQTLPIGSCPTPTGTAQNNTTSIIYKGQVSGNISCPVAGSKTVKVLTDVKAIEAALGVTAGT
jgi:hypothetical protein